MTQRIEEWALTSPLYPLTTFIREIGLPVVSITPTAWRTVDGLTVLVSAVVVFSEN